MTHVPTTTATTDMTSVSLMSFGPSTHLPLLVFTNGMVLEHNVNTELLFIFFYCECVITVDLTM